MEKLFEVTLFGGLTITAEGSYDLLNGIES